jgi:hypothetical protein
MVIGAFGTNAFAADQIKTNVFFVHGVTFPVGFSEPFGLPPSLSEGVRVSRAIKLPGWLWMGEAGIGTPATTFLPFLYATTGPSQILTDRLLLGESVAWKYTPSYGEAPSSQTLGLAVAPIWRVDFGSLTFPIGVGCSLSGHPTCSSSLGAKLLVRLN